MGIVGGQADYREPIHLAWFAVRTRSRAEKVVADHLARKGLEVFLPLVSRWSRWKDRKKLVEWPLFAGYCFAKFDPGQQLVVLSLPGVLSIVSFASVLAPIPEEQIASLRTFVSSHLQYDPAPFIRKGHRVEVVSGPLAGVVGRLVRKGQHARLVLTIDLIKQAVSVEVDAADVRSLE
jgi:transcriptional antiterminator NusG